MSSKASLVAVALTLATILTATAGESERLKDFATPVVELRPLPKRAMFEVQTGALWLLNDETQSDFLLIATNFIYEPEPHFVVPLGPGSISLGPNFKILADVYAEGPESYYLGLAGGAVLEYWLPGDTTAIYFRPSGGFGVTDSAGEEGDGQGQDFTLNYEFELGVRHAITEDVSISLSAYFQHFSNGGMTEYNIGYDQLGPMIGVSWSF